ncbi:phosphate/phosphite/phosphonate ABC transporter substrate-binding protein [Anaerobacillus alkaliphilus]|uniref:Phosphate/phosphite/phosphonate ABC transporter substrate-binding protein n=1 Tax=Anaerobacillus alkaliphilus TaxID=1548597 RepID=A0A4Q0VQ56_9BACI|nr:phosphate/phosphite/phosphonate ABC transporter substrate-binding protein [Anaerobacillus alkaliphilus]RXI98398.1 phosphate/phosphite/phosphonate ABC transporter substrate-binding protein [Anaerobacillus alkaliphilus]
MKKYLLLVLSAMLMFVLAACGSSETSTEEVPATETTTEATEEVVEMPAKLTMGFIPSQEADKIADTVKPLEEKLSEILGIPVEAQVMVDFVGLVEGMRTGQIDIGFLNPFGFVQAEERAGVEVILKSIRNGSDSYQAQYAVAADSDIHSIEDLVEAHGLVWAYADTLSTSGFLFPAAHIMSLGVENLDDHFTQIVVGGHDNAILAVLDGTADFASTFDDARTRLEAEYPTIMEDIRIIGYTNPIPNDTISVRAGLPVELKEAIRTAFLAFNEDEDMMQVMNEVYTWSGIAPAASADYDVVRDVFNIFKDQLSQ